MPFSYAQPRRIAVCSWSPSISLNKSDKSNIPRISLLTSTHWSFRPWYLISRSHTAFETGPPASRKSPPSGWLRKPFVSAQDRPVVAVNPALYPRFLNHQLFCCLRRLTGQAPRCCLVESHMWLLRVQDRVVAKIAKKAAPSVLRARFVRIALLEGENHSTLTMTRRRGKAVVYL